ncbi:MULTISPECIES: FecR family protein [unclassified Pseudomonas]|uniref:FecR family protein n=1 Tax=unclassified Pseudomonas TaxID=196821 RepID=UPI00244D4BFB|nr:MULTISPECIES: FecR family protein [unclassified Pseudomonas]MDG9925061.1 FecR family protein [Pseudomonas sp. GD04045]MDH0037064.1 FecR family protein [Pseudomonas sp. GD04019]
MSGTLDPQVIHQAAQWFVQLHSPEASAREHEECARWRASHADHEAAWQKALHISQRLGQVPVGPGMSALGRRQRINRRDLLKTLMLAGVALPFGWAGYRGASSQGWLADYRTGTGERRSLELADGSLLQLNAASAIDLQYDVDCRRLHFLRGQALLQMVDEARPFVVRTDHGCVRGQAALFDIHQDTDGTRIAVLEGNLDVHPRDSALPPLRLQAGRQVRFDSHGAGLVQALQGQPDAWTRGVLQLQNGRLDEFAAALQRYRPGFVTCAAEVAGLRLSGAFQLDNSTPVLDSLPQVLPVRVAYRTRYWVAILPA